MNCEQCGGPMHWEGSLRSGSMVCPLCVDGDEAPRARLEDYRPYDPDKQIEAYRKIAETLGAVPAPDVIEIWCGNCGYKGDIHKGAVSHLAHGPCPICGQTGYLQPTYQAPKILRCGHCGMRTPADRVYGNPSNATCPHCFATGRMIEVT